MKCQICGNSIGNQEYIGTEYMLEILSDFKYFRCSQCGCLQIAEIPEDMGKYYGEKYYSYNLTAKYKKLPFYHRFAYEQRGKYYFFRKNVFGWMLAQMFPSQDWFQYVGWNPKDAVLDIGCGDGYFLYLMGKMGFQNLTGLDPFIEKDIHGEKYTVYKKELSEWEQQYDTIIMSHSLEHMSDHLSVMQNINRLLKDNGKAIIRIPLFSDFLFNHYGKYWVSWDAPRHFYLHTLDSFKIILEQSNLKIVQVTPEPHLKNIISSEERFMKYENVPGTVNLTTVKKLYKEMVSTQSCDDHLFVITKK